MENSEVYKIDLGGGEHVWAGVLLSGPFASYDDEKFAELFKLLIGSTLDVEKAISVSLSDFMKIAKSHPILSKEKDWDRMLDLRPESS